MTDRTDGPAGQGGELSSPGRRRLLAATATIGTAALAGCSRIFGGSEPTQGPVTLEDFRGSGPLVETRGEIEGPRIADLPELSGPLRIYLGGGEGGLYTDLLDLLVRIYPDFDPRVRSAPSAQLANTLIEEAEGGSTQADVFWAVDAGSLGIVADAGILSELPGEAVDMVPSVFHPGNRWVGVAGRARAIPYNTDQLSADAIPDSVMAFPETAALENGMGWAPTYGAFQSFVTAMRLIEGESATRQWLQAMIDLGTEQYNNEFFVSNAVADGAIDAGFANHYYALRVQAARSVAPIDLAFTRGDAGALINVSGAGVLADSDRQQLGANFARHLLTVEAQEFFATRTFAYPTVEGIPPVGGLPTIDELEPPMIDLSELADLEPTLALMRDVGLL